MNKTMIYGMLTALFALASCMGNGNPVSLSDLEGEWNVVELAGQSVNTMIQKKERQQMQAERKQEEKRQEEKHSND